MKVGVIHDSLRTAGGGERVCLKTIEALRERGHEVVLGTVEKTNWDVLDKVMGRAPRPTREINVANLSETPLRIYMGIAIPLVSRRIRGKCDVIVQTNGDVVPVGDIIYMHYLPASLCDDGSYREGNNILRALYSRPYTRIYKHLIENIPDSHMFANSTFTQEAIHRSLERTPSVLYPPVDIKLFDNSGNGARNGSVFVCGRFSPEKNYEFVIDVAKHLPAVQFNIVGTVTGDTSRRYYEYLRALAESCGLRNVGLVKNQPFTEVVRYYHESDAVINCKINEPFGITVVEGMAAGAIPVVHRSGGPWLDSLGRTDGTYGYSYTDAESAAKVVAHILNNDSEAEEVRKRGKERAKIFSDDTFKNRFADSIEEIARKDRRY